MIRPFKLTLKAGERVFINGAELRVDRKVSIEILNNVSFLLEQHLMSAEQATTPLQRLYVDIQQVITAASASDAAAIAGIARHAALLATAYGGHDVRFRRIGEAAELMASRRGYEALRLIRTLLPLERALLDGVSPVEASDVTEPSTALAETPTATRASGTG